MRPEPEPPERDGDTVVGRQAHSGRRLIVLAGIVKFA